VDFEELQNREYIELDEFNDIELIEGYNELIELHKYEGMIAVHDVLLQLNEKKELECIN